MYTLEGVSSVANFITLMKSLNITETPIYLSLVCSLFPKAIFLTFIPKFKPFYVTYILLNFFKY